MYGMKAMEWIGAMLLYSITITLNRNKNLLPNVYNQLLSAVNHLSFDLSLYLLFVLAFLYIEYKFS